MKLNKNEKYYIDPDFVLESLSYKLSFMAIVMNPIIYIIITVVGSIPFIFGLYDMYHKKGIEGFFIMLPILFVFLSIMIFIQIKKVCELYKKEINLYIDDRLIIFVYDEHFRLMTRKKAKVIRGFFNTYIIRNPGQGYFLVNANAISIDKLKTFVK